MGIAAGRGSTRGVFRSERTISKRDGRSFCRTPFAPAAFAREYYGGFEHFAPSRLISTTAYPGFDVDVLTAGTLAMADRVGGWLYLTGGGAVTQGIQNQPFSVGINGT